MGAAEAEALMPRLPEPLDRRLLWVLVALCLAAFAALAPHLVYPDLNLDYPFVDGDSHDWIANGLFLAGHDVRYSGRPPLLPLMLALLDRLGLLRWWPVLSLGLFLATVAGFYTLAARLFPAAAAFAAALLLLADYSLQSLALDVMADVPASCLLLWSARAFLTARARAAAAPAGQPGAAATPREPAVDAGQLAAAATPREPTVDAGQPGAATSARVVAAGAADCSRRYAWSGLLAGLSALTQPMGLLVPLAAGATLAARRRRDLATCWPWIGAALVAGCEGLWMTVGRLGFASRGDSLKDPWRLFGFHLSAVRFYLWSLVSLLGMPACLLLAAGIVLAAWRAWRGRDPEQAAASLFAVLLFLGLFGFVAFCYLWEAKRFLVYAIWPAGLLIAEALSPLARMTNPTSRLVVGGGSGEQRLPRGATTEATAAARRSWHFLPLVAVSALAIGGAALPLPEPGRDGTWAAVSPLPPLAAHLVLDTGPAGAVSDDAGGRRDRSNRNGRHDRSDRMDRNDHGEGAHGAALSSPLSPLAVIPLAPADLTRWSTFGRAASAWAKRPMPAPRRPSPALFAAADSALYLFDRPEDGGGRYRTLTRLSNALRKPVRFVPRATLAPYWGLLTVSPLARIAPDYDIYRVTLPGIAGTWLLVTPGDRPLDPRLLNQPEQPPAAASTAPPATRLARAAAEATAIAAWLGRGFAYVAVLPSPDSSDPADLYLLFLLRSTELYVIEPPAAAATRTLLARSPVESERQFGSARALATRVRGQRTAVVIFGRRGGP